MGVVWRAEDVRLAGASVAVKLLHAREAANPEIRARFEAEARTAARLRGSPHIVQVLDVGVDGEDDAPFIAMELLEGETLRDRLLRTGTLGPAELARIMWDVARGLTRAHELGVIHRDLKPANIFLVRNMDAELAKVLDFGIAKRLAGSWHHAPTATGALLGTPSYMSPEQIVSSRDVDLRADLWSLAVIAVECLTGKLPFEADNLPGLALLICQGHATLPSRLGPVPPGFDSWFQRAIQLAPDQRFRSAVEMGEELRQLCSAVPAPAPALQHTAEPDREAVAAASAGKEPAPQSDLPNASSLSLSSTITRHLTPRLLSRSRRARWAAAAGLLLIAGCTGRSEERV